MGFFSTVTEVARRGGGDEMVATRVYNLDGYLVCDLICPITSACFSRAPVLFGMAAHIDAPDTPWPDSGVPWEELPRVAVMYVSSQTQTSRAPIVMGVIKNKSSAVQPTKTQNSDSTTRTSQPGVNDASVSTQNAKVIIRDAGDIDAIAAKDFVVRSSRVLLKTEVATLKAPAIAEELVDATKPLYEAVNALLEFAESFPTLGELYLLAQASPEMAGKILTLVKAEMKFVVHGIATPPSPAPPEPVQLEVSAPYAPYDGPSKVNVLNHEDFDSPKILISSRD